MKTVSNETLLKFAKENSFEARNSAGGLDSYSNYIGKDHGALVAVVSKTRDSNTMEESNFDVALGMLGGESETVSIERFGHWACGWIETIFVDPKDMTALSVAYCIKKGLEEYPLLDDSDFSEREYDSMLEDIEQYSEDVLRDLVESMGLDELTPDQNEEALHVISIMWRDGASYFGSEDFYLRIPKATDEDDWTFRHLETCLKESRHVIEEYSFGQLLLAVLDLETKNA